jgi:hypothetical protein
MLLCLVWECVHVYAQIAEKHPAEHEACKKDKLCYRWVMWCYWLDVNISTVYICVDMHLCDNYTWTRLGTLPSNHQPIKLSPKHHSPHVLLVQLLDVNIVAFTCCCRYPRGEWYLDMIARRSPSSPNKGVFKPSQRCFQTITKRSLTRYFHQL